MTWKRIIESPVLVATLVAAGLTAAVAAFDAPTWLIVVTAVVSAIAAALVGMGRTTPVNDPRDKNGRRLTPEGR